MRGKATFILFLGFFVFGISLSIAREINQVTCTGRVVDEQGRPVTGAKVSLYKLIIYMETMSFDAERAEVTSTNDKGAFSFETAAGSNDMNNQSIILAEKEGLALGWVNWYLLRSLDAKITLGKPEVLAGQVVDESGEPVINAEVSISIILISGGDGPRYTTGKISEQLFTCKTDEAGRFRFESIPHGAVAEFVVKKSGLATVSTLDEEAIKQMQLQFKAGRTDIEIKLPVEAKIKGTVVEKETGKPIPGVRLMVFQGQKQPFTGHESVTSSQDGTFTIDALGPGKHVIQVIPDKEGTSDWVAGMVEVDVEEGGMSSGVKVELSKGGLVEITVTEQDDNTPVEGANINILSTVSKEQFTEMTDANGIVSKRLAPGQYQIMQVYKQDYPFERRDETFTIEDGKTSRFTVQLKGYPKVTGTLRDMNGRPVASARVKVCPLGRGEVTSDSEGRFKARWESQDWARDVVPYLVARHFERNLAAAVEIEEGVKVMDVNMTAGVVCVGEIVDVDGRPIENAEVYLTFWSSGHGTSMPRQEYKTGADGRYEIKAVPRYYEYSVNAGADGYGQDYVRISTEDAEDNRFEVKDIALATANLSIAGVVVDIDDKPVENANIFCQGRGQPQKSVRTDKDGKFTIDGVCTGRIMLNASKSGSGSMGGVFLYGNMDVEGGQTDIRIVISDRSSRSARREPPSLIGKSLPDFENIELVFSFEQAKYKVLLMCFFDMQQRPSRRCVMQIAEHAEQLKLKDVTVIIIQISKIEKDSLENWIKESNIPFPVGMIQADEEKARFAWGIKSLPWLILTDKSHTVIAEGFGFDELGSKLEQEFD